MPIYYLKNFIQNYKWGSYSPIKDFFKDSISNLLPKSEVWIGANEKKSSYIITNKGKHSLINLIIRNPNQVLGEQAFKSFGKVFPYLFKILAIERPLSIQIHPNKKQAQKGFLKERIILNPSDYFKKNYKDKNHKIECIYALTTLWSMIGFRKVKEIYFLINKICPNDTNYFFEKIKYKSNEENLKNLIKKIFFLKNKRLKKLIPQIILNAKKFRINPIFEWVYRLSKLYPNDINILSPIVMNLTMLKPGEAFIIPEQIIHTHMEGLGIELTINSDNVIRKGFTKKYINKKEFCKIIDYNHYPLLMVDTKKERKYEISYQTNISEFALSVINLYSNQLYLGPIKRNIEILLCTRGFSIITDIKLNLSKTFKKGETIVITSSVIKYSIQGNATIFKAIIPS